MSSSTTKTQVAVYNSKKQVVGLVDPAKVTPLAQLNAIPQQPGAHQAPKEAPEDLHPDAASAAEIERGPMPPSEVGIPSHGVAKAGGLGAVMSVRTAAMIDRLKAEQARTR